MIETEMQQLLIDAARHVGGQGLKLNNRFLVGVADVLIAIPGYRPMWLEAKRLDLSTSVCDKNDHSWRLGVTKKQCDFLTEWRYAGMLTGVASFVQEKGLGIKGLRLALYGTTLEEWPEWRAHLIDHLWIGDHTARMENIARRLMEFSR